MNSSEEIFHPIKTVRASEAIYEQIKDRIISGELKPGDRLPSERNMMELFQRSRPTIREALRMLERSGYIHTIPGSNGALVTLPSGRNMIESIGEALQIGNVSLAELSEYRLVSEGAAAAWAAERATDEDISLLRSSLDEGAGVLKHFDSPDWFRQFTEADQHFHLYISKAAKNRVSELMNHTVGNLNRVLLDEKTSVLSARKKELMMKDVQQMHEEVFKAVERRDAEAARAAMETHLKRFLTD